MVFMSTPVCKRYSYTVRTFGGVQQYVYKQGERNQHAERGRSRRRKEYQEEYWRYCCCCTDRQADNEREMERERERERSDTAPGRVCLLVVACEEGRSEETTNQTYGASTTNRSTGRKESKASVNTPCVHHCRTVQSIRKTAVKGRRGAERSTCSSTAVGRQGRGMEEREARRRAVASSVDTAVLHYSYQVVLHEVQQ